MKPLFWLLFVAAIIMLGYLVYSSASKGRPQAGLVSGKVTGDTIAAYQQRAEDLVRRSDSIRTRLGTIGLLAHPSVRARLMQMDADIAALKTAIAAWQEAHPTDDGQNLYRQCILMYGKASGTCDALAQDTLTSGK